MFPNTRGFTLIELLVVILIIGVLAAIAIPQYSSIKIKAQDASAIGALNHLADAQENYYLMNSTYTSNRASLWAASGWTVEDTIIVSIAASSARSWSAIASHISSPNTFHYTSAGGGMFAGP